MAESTLIISEILYDPIGSDTGYEWLELYNAGNTEIDVAGLKIQVAGTQFVETATISSSTKLSPNNFLLICEAQVPNCDVYVNKLAMQNGGGSTDAIRIVSNGIILDTLLYDKPNTNQLLNDVGVIETSENAAVPVKSGHSLGRKNYSDTNNSFADFTEFTTPTPGTRNTIVDYSNKILISEISFKLNYIEFFAKENLNWSQWYFKSSPLSTNKTFLPSDPGFPLFTINNSRISEFACIYLYSPDNEIQDTICQTNKSKLYSLCRLGENTNEEIKYCSPTPALQNTKFVPDEIDINELINTQPEVGTEFVSSFCYINDYKGKMLIARMNYGVIAEAKSVNLNESLCYKGIFALTDNGIQIIEILDSAAENLVLGAPITNYNLNSNSVMYISGIFYTITQNQIRDHDGNYFYIRQALTQGKAYKIVGYTLPNSVQTDSNIKYELVPTSVTEMNNTSSTNLANSGLNYVPALLALFIIFLFSVRLIKINFYTYLHGIKK